MSKMKVLRPKLDSTQELIAVHRTKLPSEAAVPGELVSLTDKLANNTLFMKNKIVDELKLRNPKVPKLYMVDKYYPYGKNHKGEASPLYVDEPDTEDEYNHYLKYKKPVMDSHGLRYVVIKKDDTLEKVMMRMGGV